MPGKKCKCANSYMFPHREEKCLLRKAHILPSKQQEKDEDEELGEDAFETEAQLINTNNYYFAEPWDEENEAHYRQRREENKGEDKDEDDNEEDVSYNVMPVVASEVVDEYDRVQGSQSKNYSYNDDADDAIPVCMVVSEPKRIEKTLASLSNCSPMERSPPPSPARTRNADEQCDCMAYSITKHRKSKCRWQEYSAALAVAGITVGAAAMMISAAGDKKHKR